MWSLNTVPQGVHIVFPNLIVLVVIKAARMWGLVFNYKDSRLSSCVPVQAGLFFANIICLNMITMVTL